MVLLSCTTLQGWTTASVFAGIGILVSTIGCVIDFSAAATFAGYKTCSSASPTNLLTCVCTGTFGLDDVSQKFTLRVTAAPSSAPSCGALQSAYVSTLNASGSFSLLLLLLCLITYMVLIVALCRRSLNLQTAASLKLVQPQQQLQQKSEEKDVSLSACA